MTASDTVRIVRFEQAAAVEHDVVGGKGANLGRMVAAGFAVPPGFTITTDAYREFIGSGGLRDRIEALLSGLDYGSADAVDAATTSIRELIVGHEMPADLAESIRAAYTELASEDFVAVRSSGTAEDLEGASFAGLHDTYLDVQGVEDVLDKVRRCWASLWTARATAYRSNRDFAHDEAALAVVVQRMVAADTAGVLFTAHPMTAAVDRFVINASWGLGEAVVSGVTTPDQFVLMRDTLQVTERTVGSKEIRFVRDPDSAGARCRRRYPMPTGGA